MGLDTGEGEIPERTCIATREAADPEELVRLVAGPDGLVHVDYRRRLPGRGAWVTPSRAAVEVLERKPAIAARALRAEVRTEGLLQRVREANRAALTEAISVAARSGSVIGGGERTREAIVSPRALALLIAADASERVIADLISRAPAVPSFEVPWTVPELGAHVGKGPRSSLVVLDGRPGRRLLRELRRFASLR